MAVTAVSMAMLSACTGTNGGAGNGASGSLVSSVVVNTTVRTTGQYPETFVVELRGEPASDGWKPEDFHMEGEAGGWQAKSTHHFQVGFSSVNLDGNTLTLVPEDFPEKYFYVESFTVKCDVDSALDFTETDITEINTPVVDDFVTYTREDGSDFNYHLYTPAQTDKMPVVVVFHGFGDTSNLLTYRTAVEWAEPENQKERPCYVLAPVIEDAVYYNVGSRSDTLEKVKALLDTMVSEGKVDPDRIYVMGNSFGGMSSIEFAERFPETTAGVLALCPALNYSASAKGKLEQMKDVPVYFCHAEHDGTIPVTESRKAVEILEGCGAAEVHFKEFSDEEMNAAGGSPDSNSTYSYHHVELAAMSVDTYMDWLYSR